MKNLKILTDYKCKYFLATVVAFKILKTVLEIRVTFQFVIHLTIKRYARILLHL